MAFTKEQRAWIAEGKTAFQPGDTTPNPPYSDSTRAWSAWLHGWWGAYYAHRDTQIAAGKLCGYCCRPIDNLTGSFVITRGERTLTVCPLCKDELTRDDGFTLVAQAKSLA